MWLIGALLAALSLSMCEREGALTAQSRPTVLVANATVRDVPVYREWLGTLEGSESADVRARVTGHIISRDYQEGALVKKGDLLFRVDPRPFETAIAEAKYQLEQGIAAMCASEAEYDRSVVLFREKVISEKEFINKTQLRASNRAKVKALNAALTEAKLNLEYSRITAPINGIAGIAQAHIGDLVGSSSNMVLASVATVDPIRIVFPVSEGDYLAASTRLQEALKKPLDQRPRSIELILADGTVFPQKARLLSVDLQLRASTGTILVTALLPNPGNILRPGFFGRARIETSVLHGAVVVPQRTVNEIQGSYQIWVVTPDGKAEMRPVTAGDRTGSDWVITSGLKEGEKVIVEGAQKVKAGMLVNAKPWNPSTPASPAPTPEETSDTQQEAK